MKKFLILALAPALTTTMAYADPVTSITIYGNTPQSWERSYYPSRNQQGYAILTMARQVSVYEGINAVAIVDLPQGVDSDSLMIKNLPAYQQVLEQNFSSRSQRITKGPSHKLSSSEVKAAPALRNVTYFSNVQGVNGNHS